MRRIGDRPVDLPLERTLDLGIDESRLRGSGARRCFLEREVRFGEPLLVTRGVADEDAIAQGRHHRCPDQEGPALMPHRHVPAHDRLPALDWSASSRVPQHVYVSHGERAGRRARFRDVPPSLSPRGRP